MDLVFPNSTYIPFMLIMYPKYIIFIIKNSHLIPSSKEFVPLKFLTPHQGTLSGPPTFFYKWEYVIKENNDKIPQLWTLGSNMIRRL